MENPWVKYWTTSRDLVYRELAKYPNEYIKNACDAGLRLICKDVGFWQNLWQVKFGAEAPEGDLNTVRKAFYDMNFWTEMKEVVSTLPPIVEDGIQFDSDEDYIAMTKLEDRKKVERAYSSLPGLSINELKAVFAKYPRLYLYVREEAIRHNSLDVLLVSILKYLYFRFNDTRDLKGKQTLTEDLLRALPENKYIQLISNSPLSAVIYLPRAENECNSDLVNIHLENNVDSIGTFEFSNAIIVAIRKNCQEIIDILLSEIRRRFNGETYDDLLYRLLVSAINLDNSSTVNKLIKHGADPIKAVIYSMSGEINEEITKDIILKYEEEFATYFAQSQKAHGRTMSFRRFKDFIRNDEDFKPLREKIMNKWIALHNEGDNPNVNQYNQLVADLNI